jgi:hypothetical protein
VQQVNLTDLPGAAERAAAISLFDARFGEMEQVLWFLSVHSRPGLLTGESSPELEALVWTVKSWSRAGCLRRMKSGFCDWPRACRCSASYVRSMTPRVGQSRFKTRLRWPIGIRSGTRLT